MDNTATSQKSSFVRQSLSPVDYVRQHLALQIEGNVAQQLHHLNAFVLELETVIGMGLKVSTNRGMMVVTHDDVQAGVGDDRFEELKKMIRLFRGALVELDYSSTPLVSNVFLGSEEPEVYVQQSEKNTPGVGKSKSVNVVPLNFSTEPPTQKQNEA